MRTTSLPWPEKGGNQKGFFQGCKLVSLTIRIGFGGLCCSCTGTLKGSELGSSQSSQDLGVRSAGGRKRDLGILALHFLCGRLRVSPGRISRPQRFTRVAGLPT